MRWRGEERREMENHNGKTANETRVKFYFSSFVRKGKFLKKANIFQKYMFFEGLLKKYIFIGKVNYVLETAEQMNGVVVDL